MLNKLKTGLFVALCLLAGASYADLNEAQQSVWEVVEQSWVDDVARNGKWSANYVHDEVVNWGEEWPTPREGVDDQVESLLLRIRCTHFDV